MPIQTAGASQTIKINMVHPSHNTLGPYAEYHNHRTNTKASMKSEFAYVNTGYVGSTHSVSENRLQSPPVSVIREQYWACSKWTYATRLLAITVGVLLGAVIGLSILVAIKGDDKDFADIFRTRPAPD